MPDGHLAMATCPGCGWNIATSDGYCLDCATPELDEEMEPRPCPQCGEIDCMEDTHGPA